MKKYLNTKKGIIQIEEPKVNKLYEELTRMIVLSGQWENVQYKTLLRICLKARNRKKLIYAHEMESDIQDLNCFYTNKPKDNFSLLITGAFILLDGKEVSASEAYLSLVSSGVVKYKRNNIFDLVKQNILLKKYKYRRELIKYELFNN